MITLGALMKQLGVIAEHAGDGYVVRINGEYLETCIVTLQNPIIEEINGDEPWAPVKRDPERSEVLDISANGREPPELEVRKVDMRKW